MSHKLSRREFLVRGLAAGGSAILTACTSPSGPMATETQTAEVQEPATSTPQPTATQAPTAAPTDAIPKGGTIRIKGSTGKRPYYSPLWYMGSVGWNNSMPHIWPPLIFFEPNGEAAPYLAERDEYSQDMKAVTFYLHETAKWSDGHPLTAEDVKFTYETLIKYINEIGTAWGFLDARQILGGEEYANGQAESVSGIKVIDPKTVRFELTGDAAGFVRYLWRAIAPKHMYEGCETFEDLENAPFTKNSTVHSGPFRLGKYEEANYIELVPVHPYWVDAPNLHEVKYVDKVIMYQIQTEQALNMMEAGELDIYLGAASVVERASEMEGFTVHTAYGYASRHLPVNMHRPHMKDKRVRQAMMYALDREALNEIALGGWGKVTVSPINDPEWAVNPNIDPYDYNPDRARELLEEVGWDPDQEVVYLSFTTEGEDLQAAWFQQCLADVGIKVSIHKEAYTALQEVLARGDFDVWPQGGGRNSADPAYKAEQYLCDSWYSLTDDYCNPELDSLVAEYRATPDQEGQQRIAWRMAEVLQDELPSLWLLEEPSASVVSDRVGNFQHGRVTGTGGTWQMTDYYVKG